MKPPSPGALQRHPSVRPPPLRRDEDRPLRVEEFAVPTTELRLSFPFAWDATTMQGAAALRDHLPGEWPDALELAEASFAPIAPDTRLRELLARPSARTRPGGLHDLNRVAGRRSSRVRLRDVLPDLELRAIDARALASLYGVYRKAAKAQSSPTISADLTELRCVVNAARAAVGMDELPAAPRAARPNRRVGRAPERDLAGLDEVERVLRECPPELRVFVGLRVATTVPVEHLLALRRGAIDLDRFRMTIDASCSRSQGRGPAHLVVGLPPWCVALLRQGLPGVDAWVEQRPLFPRNRGSSESRREFAHAFRKAADDANLPDLTLSDIRRLSQAIHATAPRAVRRATAGAGRGTGVLARAQEEYASQIVAEWQRLHTPPVQPKRVPRRAPKHTRPHERERGSGRNPVVAPSISLPASCLVGTQDPRLGSGGGRGERRLSADNRGKLTERATGDDGVVGPVGAESWTDGDRVYGAAAVPTEMQLRLKDAEIASLLERAERAEWACAHLRATTISVHEAELGAAGMGITGLVGGVAIGERLARHPHLVESMADGGKRLFVALVGELAKAENGQGPR